MQDQRGIYYYPQPGDTTCRVYVRHGENKDVEFRLWLDSDPSVWERHQWLPQSVLAQADALYKAERNAKAAPLKLYDMNVARALLGEADKA